MADTKISDSVIYIGADDHDIDLFESQYVVPNGVSYNSYVIIDEKIAVMDTADPRVTDVWFDNLEKALGGRKPDYLVVQHMEPDHAGNIKKLAEKYPEMKIVGNAKTPGWYIPPQDTPKGAGKPEVPPPEAEAGRCGVPRSRFFQGRILSDTSGTLRR